MKVLFDGSPLIGKNSGVGNFTYRLLDNLSKSHITDDCITVFYFNFLGTKKIKPLPKHKNITYKEIRFFPSKAMSLLHRIGLQLPLELFVGFDKYDCVVYSNFVSYPSIKKTKSFVAIHDLSFIDCPEYTQNANKNFLKRFVPKSIKRATGILTISEFTKKRIQKFYSVAANKILVLPIPYEDKQPIDNVSQTIRTIAKQKFFLFVGTIEPRKNIIGLINGFAKLAPEIRKEYSLVLAGAVGWKTESTIKAIEKNKDTVNCIITGYVNDAERNFLYKNTAAVCLLSHYEGFGMPILEAAYFKKPLVLSSIEVFKEVAGPTAYYCDANNPKDVARALKESITAKKPRLVKKDFSWQKNITELNNFVKNKLREADI